MQAFSTYQDALNFLFQQLPMYQRHGKRAFRPGLENIKYLLEQMGNPQDQFQSIHLAGTNGKGSTSHIIAALLQAKGLKVGLYTSPHYADFRERIKINGVLIPKDKILQFVNQYHDLILDTEASYFEMTVAMAFDYFAHAEMDIAVIETGLGGLLDSTNVIYPLLSVITNISHDHMDILGETLPEIAFQKAGIIKKNTPVVVGAHRQETAPVFRKRAAEEESELIFAENLLSLEVIQVDQEKQWLKVEKGGEVWLDKLGFDLLGAYQVQNLRTALAAILRLPNYVLSEDEIRLGIGNIKQSTYFIGRWQVLSNQPLIITDAGHNEAGIQLSMEQIAKYDYDQLHMVIGFSTGKDHQKLADLMPNKAMYYLTQPSVPRRLPVEELVPLFISKRGDKIIYKDSSDAIQAALNNATPRDLIFIGG
ncbi:MAG: folylpolyglutamate synthase/dihydrofolate synthase family protein, partial [Bacteroidota bacterium]